MTFKNRFSRSVATALLAVCFAVPTYAQVAETSSVPAVTVSKVQKREIKAVVPVSGTVRPYNEVEVNPQLNGVQ